MRSVASKKALFTMAVLAAAVALPAASMGQIQTAYTWDSSGSNPSAPVDGSGNWDTATADWSSGTADVVWPNDTSTAVFGHGGTAGTVTLQTVINAGAVLFNPVAAGTYTIASNGSALTLVGNAGVGVNTNANISAPIAGSVGLNVGGTGTLNLSGVNTYTGATVINGGTLQLGAANTLPATTALTVNSGATLDTNNETQTVASLTGAGTVNLESGSNLTLNQSTSTIFSGQISGSGTLTKLLGGTLTMTAAEPNFTGQLAITNTVGNTLVLSGNANINNSTIAVTMNNMPNGGGPSFNLGNLTTPLSAPISYTTVPTGSDNVGSDDLRLSFNAMAGSGNMISSPIAVTFANSGTYTSNPSLVFTSNAGNLAVSSNITVNSDAVNGQIVFRGSQAESFTGEITAPAATIIATTDAGLCNFAPQADSTYGNLHIGGTYTIAISSDAAATDSAPVTGGSNGLIIGGGTLRLNNYTSTLNFIQANMVSTDAFNLGAATGAPSTFAGSLNLTSTNAVNFVGPGTLILAGPMSYSGKTTVTAGTLQLGGSSILPSPVGGSGGTALTVNAGATLDLNGNYQAVKSLAGAGNILLTGSSSELDLDTSTGTFSGNISGAGQLDIVGGSLTLSGNNTYTGETYIGGTLTVGSATGISAGSDVANFGTLAIGTYSPTLGSLSGFGTVTGSGNLTVGADNNSETFGGQINTTGSLTLVGSSIFQMAGSTSTYTGATNINSGTLQLEASNPLPITTTLTIAGGGTFDTNGNSQQVGALSGSGAILLSGQLTVGGASTNSSFSGSISGGGTLIVAEGNYTLSLTGTNSFTGATQLNSGTLAINSDSAINTSQVSFNGGTLQFINYASSASFDNVSNLSLGAVAGAVSSLSGAITGSNSLTYTGPGTLILTNTGNNYSGGTNINGGNLQFAAGVFPVGSSITINNGGALNLTGAFTTVSGALPSINPSSTGAVALMGDSSENINFANYHGLALGAAANSTYTGTITPSGGNYNLGGGGATLTLPITNAITGTNNLVIGSTGSTGTVVLGSTNNYTGSTTLNGSILAISSDASVNNAAGITFAGGTLQFNNYTSNLPALTGPVNLGAATGAASTLNSAITDSSNSSSLTYMGPGTLILNSGANTYSGATTINGGTLALGAAGALPSTTALTINAGSLDLNGNSQTVASLAGTGNVITETGATLSIGSPTNTTVSNTTFSGSISGAGGLTNNNAGTLTLTGSNNLTGPVNVIQNSTTASSTLALSGAGSINSASSLNLINSTGTGGDSPNLNLSNLSSALTVPINVVLPTSGGDYRVFFNNVAGANTISSPISLIGGNNGTTPTSFTFASTTGPLTVSSALTVSGSNSVATVNGVTSDGQLVIRGIGATSSTIVGIFNGSIGGSGAANLIVAKTDPGAWLWEPAAGSVWGPTQIGVGDLIMGEASAMDPTTTVTIGGTSAVTMDLNGFDQTIAGLILTSGTPTTNPVLVTNTSATPATLTIATTGSHSYGQTDSTIGGNLAITISGTGTEIFPAANTYTGGTNLNGGTLEFTALTDFGSGQITFNGGTLEYPSSTNTVDLSTAPVTIGPGGAIINTNGATLTYNFPLSGGGPFTKTGAGSITMVYPANFAGLTVSAGTLRLENTGNTISGALSINGSATLELDGSTTATQLLGDGTGTLNITSGNVKPSAQAHATLKLAALSIAVNSTLDLGNGNLTVTYGAGADPTSTIVNYLQNGYNQGLWNAPSSIGGAILSSAVASLRGTTLGYVDNTALQQVQVKYTWYGDLDLSGTVDNTDLIAMNAGDGSSWAQGDLNYDGVKNADDYSLFAYGNALQNGSISAGVREPTGAALLIAPIAAGLGLRKRRR